MNLFSDFMVRLKSQVGLSKDKEIAELLGLSTTAFSERKKRDSVPIREVFELAKNRPDLGLDPDWVVTGTSKRESAMGDDETSLMQCYRAMSMQQKYSLREIALLWSGTMILTAPPKKQLDYSLVANDHTNLIAAEPPKQYSKDAQ